MSELLVATFDTDKIIRMQDDGDRRTLSGYAVPWNTPARVMRPVPGLEFYRRGALTKSINEAKVIPLFSLHREEAPIGRLTDSRDDEFGQAVTFRLSDTPAAREAAEMVREGIWTSFSIGAYAMPDRTRTFQRNGEQYVERSEVKLDHVALLRKPAFEGARVLALREEDLVGSPDARAIAAARMRRRARQMRL